MTPPAISIRLGARLSGRSEPSFRRHILPHVAAADGRVSTARLERYLDCDIGALEYAAAQSSLEPRRTRERQYRRKV